MDRVTVSFLASDRAQPHLVRLVDGVPDDEVLPTLERLRRDLSPAEAAAVVETAHLRVAARSKFERARQMLFTRDALEQASGEIPARHRVGRFEGATSIVDLGCGIGGDALVLGGVAPTVGIDRDPVRVAMTAHNAAVYDSTVSPVVGDLLTPPLATAEAVFADPARRAGERRRLRAERYLPPLDAVVAVGRRLSPRLAIKVAPGIDHHRIPPGSEAEFVSVAGEVRECVLWMGDFAGTVRRRATVLPEGLELTDLDPAEGGEVASIGTYLHEPDGAVIRAGLVEHLAVRMGGRKIDPDIAYLTGETPVADGLATSYRVERVMAFNLKPLKAHLRELGVGVVTIKKRGSPLTPEALRSRLDLSGSEHRVVFLTRAKGEPVAVIAHPVTG